MLTLLETQPREAYYYKYKSNRKKNHNRTNPDNALKSMIDICIFPFRA
jgi:hypothetical protein